MKTKNDQSRVASSFPRIVDGDLPRRYNEATRPMKNCFVYLSGPITAKHGYSVEQNVADAVKVFLEALRLGIPAFCPHLSGAFPSAHSGIDYETWLAYDFAVIDRCTHILMLSRWETSEGAVRELDYARGRGMRSFFSLNALHQAVGAVDPHAADPGTPTPRV